MSYPNKRAWLYITVAHIVTSHSQTSINIEYRREPRSPFVFYGIRYKEVIFFYYGKIGTWKLIRHVEDSSCRFSLRGLTVLFDSRVPKLHYSGSMTRLQSPFRGEKWELWPVAFCHEWPALTAGTVFLQVIANPYWLVTVRVPQVGKKSESKEYAGKN